MADLIFPLDNLSAGQSLHILAEAARELAAANADKASALRHLALISVRPPEGRIGSYTLCYPDFSALKGDKKELSQQKAALDALREAYRRLTTRPPRTDREDHSPQAWPWPLCVIKLLEHSRWQEGATAVPLDNESLFVGRDLTHRRAAEILTDLSFFGTHTLAAGTTTADGAFDLFHVKTEAERKSALPSALAGDFFSDCTRLAAYSCHGAIVFLPPNFNPQTEALAHFCMLLEAGWPAFFGSDLRRLYDRLAAVIAEESANETTGATERRYTLLGLADLEFRSQVGYAPDAESLAGCEVFELRTSSERAAHLRDEIARAKPPIGYHLELRRTRYRDVSQVQFERLQRRQEEIEQQLAYLTSIAQPSPMLLRFTQRQLPALADLLRSYPGRVLEEGRIKYGFQATRLHPEGLHFLWIEPDVVMTEMDPLMRWQKSDDLPMRFWLDPFWARYYHGQGNPCLVFTPHGMALFPSMHAWDVGSMDAYMREIMGVWFHGSLDVRTIPARPIYLFDGIADADAKIEITVLDFDGFQPLKARLGWMTDHLTILDDLGAERFIEELARMIKDRTIDEGMAARAEEAQHKFDHAADGVSGHVAEHTIALTRLITRELDRIIDETNTTTAQARALNERLLDLRALYETMAQVNREAETLTAETRKKLREVRQTTDQLATEVEHELSRAEDVRAQLDRQIGAAIDSLRSTRYTLQHRLDDLKQMR